MSIAYTHHLSILLTPTPTHFLSFEIPFIHRPFSFFSTNTTHHTTHHTPHSISLHSSPHSSTASPNSSITVITVILRFSRSNARLPASLTIPEVAIAARIAALLSAASARFDHKFMSPATPATMSPCPPQRRSEAGLSLQTTSTPSEIRSMAPF